MQTLAKVQSNTTLAEELTSLLLAYDTLSTTFDELGLSSTPIVEDDQYSETVENIEDNLTHTITDLMASLDMIERALESAESLPTLNQPWLPIEKSLEKVVDNDFVESNGTDIPFKAKNQTLPESEGRSFSEEISKIYSTVENDVKNIIKELLKETEENKNIVVLDKIVEEPDFPFSSDCTDLFTRPSSFSESKSITNSNVDNTCTSSNDENGQSQGDVQNEPMDDSRRLYDSVLQEVKSNRPFWTPSRFDKAFFDNKDPRSNLLFATDINTGEPCSCSLIRDAELEIDKKKAITYFCNTPVSRIPLTSFSFGGNSRQNCCREQSAGKGQTKSKNVTDVTEEIISGDSIKAKNEITNQIGPHAINTLQVDIGSNINLRTCIIGDTENSYDSPISLSCFPTVDNSSRFVTSTETNSSLHIFLQNQQPSFMSDQENGVSKFMPYGDTAQTVFSDFNVHFQSESVPANMSDLTISSSSSSSTSNRSLLKSQKLFNITNRFDTYIETNSLRFLSDEHEDEEVINNIDLTNAVLSTDTNSETEILIKVQNLANSQMDQEEPSTGTSSHSNHDVKEPKLEVIVMKPTIDSMISESYSGNMADDNIYEDTDGASSSTLSHYVLKTALGSLKFKKIQEENKTGEDLISSEVELSSQETLSNEDLKSKTSQLLNLSQIRLNLPVLTCESRRVLNTPEEIAFIEENVRVNDLLAQQQKVSSESIDADEEIYSDAETSETSDENETSSVQ